jgi:hypothetical protein
MPRGSTLGREFWRKHNVAYEGSGQSQPAYCALHGLNAKTFARWRTVFRRGSSTSPPRQIKPPRRKPANPGFVRLHVDDEVAQGAVSAPSLAGNFSGIAISHGDIRIDVARGFDRPTLAAILSLLRAT